MSDRILVVDDNPQNAKLARVLLGSAGYEVRTASDAEEALALIGSFEPKLIVMDVQMPGMDGLELTRRLKADPRYRAIVIVVLTAHAMKGDEEVARAAGCDGYVTKPMDPSALVDVVRAHLARQG